MLIAKLGFLTELYDECNNTTLTLGQFEDEAYCYDFLILLSERTGVCHNEIVLVAGSHLIEEETENRFVIWFANNEEAEPYSSYKTLAEAMDDLQALEELSFA